MGASAQISGVLKSPGRRPDSKAKRQHCPAPEGTGGRDRRKGAAWPRSPTLVAECDQLLDDLDDYIEAALDTPFVAQRDQNATTTDLRRESGTE